MPKINIVTASKCNIDGIKRLAESLHLQSCQDYSWLVSLPTPIDPACNFLKELDDRRITIITDTDQGIYSALNQCLRLIPEADYYIVAGDDDEFAYNAIELFYKAMQDMTQPAILTANVLFKGSKTPCPKYKSIYRKGQMHSISSHVLGTCIPLSLHRRFGCYDETLRIAGDEDFLLKCILAGIKFRHFKFVAGTVGSSGISSRLLLQTLSESLKVRARYLNHKLVALVFAIKLLRGLPRF